VKQRLNVCIISREFVPDTSFGGIGTFSLDLARILARADHRVTVISQSLTETSSTDIDGIRVEKLFLPGYLGNYRSLPLLMFGFNAYAWRRLRQLHAKDPFDIVDAPDHLAEGLFASLFTNIPVVARLHTPFSLIVDMGLNAYRNSLSNKLIFVAERVALNRAKILYSPTEDMLGRVRKLFRLSSNQHFGIHGYPVDRTVFSPKSQTTTQGEPFSVLFVGRFEHRKGVDIAADAFVELHKIYGNRVRIRFVGADTNNMPGNASALSVLREIFAKAGCIDAVEISPPVDLASLALELQQAHVLWVPSRYDNYPLTVLESFACGTPVVASKTGGLIELVQEHKNGLLVENGVASSFVRATSGLIENCALLEALGAGAVEYAEQTLSESAVYEGTLGLYRKAIVLKK
jgi:glycogen synthase